MKAYINLLFLCILSLPLAAQSPPSSLDLELQEISSTIVRRLNLAEFRGSLMIWDFTDTEGNPTVLGAYIASEFRSLLLDSDRMFTIKDRDENEKSGEFLKVLGKVVNTASQGVDLVVEDRRNAEAIKRMGENADVFFRPSNKDKSLRKVDAILDGTITNMGESYRVNVYVKRLKTNDFLASAKGDLSKVKALTMLDQQASQKTADNSNPSGYSSKRRPGTSSSAPLEFKKQHLKFELIECREVSGGRYLECEFRVTSEGKSSKVSITRSGSKIFNQNNLTEHQPTSVNISDVTYTGGNWASKTLLRDSPVSSIITFEPDEVIDVIASLQIRCSLEGVGEFYVDFSDIFVKK